MGTWEGTDAVELSAENLGRLFDNRVAAIRIPAFAAPAECAAFADAMREVGLDFYTFYDEEPVTVGFIGTSQFEFRYQTKADYFAAVPGAVAHQRQVLDRSWDPVGRMIETLAAVCPANRVDYAREGSEPYFAGIIRNTTGGVKLHADFAPYYAPGYAISRIDAQITWNLYVEAPPEGGVLRVHNAPWTCDPAPGEVINSYPMPPQAVAGAACFEAGTVAGDVLMFNTRNPHEISGGQFDQRHGRLQIGSFVGRLPGGDLVLWS